jgi:hypothetical protein
MKPVSLAEITRRVEQKRAKLANLRPESFGRRQDYVRAYRLRELELERWERLLLAATAAKVLSGSEDPRRRQQ